MMLRKPIVLILGLLVLFVQTSCHHSSLSESEMEELMLMRPYHTKYNIGYAPDTIVLPIVSNTEWMIYRESEWVHLSALEGIGTDTVYAYIDANICSSPRDASIVVSLKKQNSKNFTYQIEQNGYSSLLSVPGYEKGAGFAYDVTAEYCHGMTWQIFDVQALDYYQYQIDPETGTTFQYGNLVADNIEAYNEEQYVAGNTLDEVETILSASATIDMDVRVVDVEVSGNVQLKEWEKQETVYGIKRSKRIVFVRDIQYLNCVAAVKNGLEHVFTPAFYADWSVLENARNGADIASCNRFLDKWGIAFVCRSCMGGSFDYEMEIEKKALGNELTVEAALNAAVLGSVLKANANGGYTDLHEKIKNSYSSDLHVYGGDVQMISILTNRSDSINVADYENWRNSIVWGVNCNNPAVNNAVLVDVKIASIASLFTGQTRRNIEEAITHRLGK